MSITPQTAGQDRGEARTAAPGVPTQREPTQPEPTQRGERPPGTADPLVGPAVTGSSADGQRTDRGSARRAHDVPVEPRSDLSRASTGELVRRLSTQLSELIRGELELARVELTAKGKRAGAGAGLAGAGGVVALFGVGALVAAAIAALALVVPVWLSALIIGVVLLLVAGLLALAGRKQLRGATPPVPEQAVESVHRDVETVKGAVQHR
jgi:uncharacterized membrane protein YqjE